MSQITTDIHCIFYGLLYRTHLAILNCQMSIFFPWNKNISEVYLVGGQTVMDPFGYLRGNPHAKQILKEFTIMLMIERIHSA